jgi:phage-related protein
LLTQIAQHLGGYSDTTQKHFIQLTSAADNFISQATGRLSGSIDELGEQLDELQSAVASIVHVTRTAA